MNKNVFITGGTSGIGKSLIHKLAKNRYNIFFTYFNNPNKARQISKELKKYNISCNYTKMDLANEESINKAFKKFSQQFKKINIFINNASPKIKRINFLKLKNKDILKYIKSLLVGNIITLKNALKIISKQKSKDHSTVINVSSYSSISGGRDFHLYAASKSAINTITVALSKDKIKNKIKFFSIVPRYVDTPSFRVNNNIKNNKDLILFKKNKKIKKINSSEDFSLFIYKKFIKNSNNSKKTIIYYD